MPLYITKQFSKKGLFMSSTIGISTFGSLTSKTGRKVTFAEFDKNGDNVISTSEFNSLVKELNLDKLSFKTVDTNGDNKISQEEFNLWDQKVQIQDFINNKLAFLASETALSSSQKSEIKSQLMSFFNEYIEQNKDKSLNPSQFSKLLEQKYREIKENCINTAKTTAKTNAINSVKPSLSARIKSKVHSDNDMVNNEELYNTVLNTILAKLENIADSYISKYEGTSLEFDLTQYLTNYLKASDKDRLYSSSGDTINKINGLNENTEDDEENSRLKALKKDCEEILKQAVNENIVIKMQGLNICSETTVNIVLSCYKDYKSLLKDIKDVINNLSTLSNEDTIVQNEVKKAEKIADSVFINFKGSNYKVDCNLIDFSWIYQQFGVSSKEEFADKEIHERGKGWEGSRDKAYDEGSKILNAEEFKSQFKKQIQEKLQAQGIPYSRIENIFENVYNNTVVETLNTENMITGRGARGLSSKGHAYIKVQQLLNTFIDKFNSNIETAVDSMNKSQMDMDTIDMDLKHLDEDGSGNKIKTENNDDIVKAYQTGKILKTRKCGADYYNDIAEQILEGLKKQLLAKAKAMCKANSIEFDQTTFDSVFEKAKTKAVEACVAGITSKGEKTGALAASGSTAVLGAGAAIGAAALTTTATTGFTATGLTGFWSFLNGTFFATGTSTTLLGSSAAASTVPVAGWIAAGVGVLATLGLAIFGGGRHSESYLDVKSLVDGFINQFANEFSEWVENKKKY